MSGLMHGHPLLVAVVDLEWALDRLAKLLFMPLWKVHGLGK